VILLQEVSKVDTVMSDTGVIGFGHHLETTLGNIRHVLTTEMPTYIRSRRRAIQLGSSGTGVVSYKVLNCHFTSLQSSNSLRNLTFDVYRAEIEIQENRTVDDEEVKVVKKESLIVKKIKGNPDARDMCDSKNLFYVESKMFSDVIPLLLSSVFVDEDFNWESSSSNLCKAYLLFPKCYYTSRKCKESLIVLEDVQKNGYRFGGRNSLLMDFDHIILALEGLARFHALSYAMKKKDPQNFYSSVVQKIRKGKKYRAEDKDKEQMYAHAYFKCLQYAALQPLEIFAAKYVNADHKYKSSAERLKTLMEDTVGLIRQLLVPKEPLAALCHGNFNMKNILFRHDTYKKPTAVKFTDFQNVHYASPAVDLSLFLFMNASPELRADKWDDLFSAYHRNLLKAISEFLNCPEDELLPEYSIEAFKEEFSKHAMYGYVLTAGCLTSALSKGVRINKMFEMFSDGLPSEENVDKCIRENLKLEGDEVTYRLVSLIKELVDEGYL
jgi:hypothetical protein